MPGAGHERLIPPEQPALLLWIRFLRSEAPAQAFHAVRIATAPGLDPAGLADTATPLIVLLNHASWWDPLVAFHLARRFVPLRPALAPMDREQLERFGFFRRIGVFGIDPDDAESLVAMRDYVQAELTRDPATSIWLTPRAAPPTSASRSASDPVRPASPPRSARSGPSRCRSNTSSGRIPDRRSWSDSRTSSPVPAHDRGLAACDDQDHAGQRGRAVGTRQKP